MLRIDQTVPEAFNKKFAPFFTFEEMKCKCGGKFCDPLKDDWWLQPEFTEFMRQAIMLRKQLHFPFHVNSGYRCPRYNDSLYKGDGKHLDGPHVHGAMDISVSFERSYALTAMATDFGMGVGCRQHGNPDLRFIHLDNRGARLWTYNAN